MSEQTRLKQKHPQAEQTSRWNPLSNWRSWILPLTGLFSLLWFLIRVIPKPSRASYLCQRAAFPLASGFVMWLVGLVTSLAAYRRARVLFRTSRANLALVCLAVAVVGAGVAVYYTPERLALADDLVANQPVGVGQGLFPGRVAWVHDPNITDWAGPGSGRYWFDTIDKSVADRMMKQAICGYAGTDNLPEAWDLIFRHFNWTKGKGDVGYAPGEKIAMKLNWTTCYFGTGGYRTCDENYDKTDRSPNLDTTENTPEILHALLSHLVNIVGVAPEDISMGDPTGQFANHSYKPLVKDFPGVRFMDDRGGQGRTLVQLSDEPFYWSSPAAEGTRQDYVPQYYADAEYFINIPLLKSHDLGGITVCAKNHYGSLQRTPVGNFRTQGKPDNPPYFDLHNDLPGKRSGMGHYRPLVDLMGHEHIGGKTLLYLVDAIFGGRKWDSKPSTWTLPPFGDGDQKSDWPCSLFVSMDPVAIDSVAYDFLIEQWPEHASIVGSTDYLVEAALADNPPSGTFYDPDHAGNVQRLPSLGVHEHWNNKIDKQYSRNLGADEGIELVRLSSSGPILVLGGLKQVLSVDTYFEGPAWDPDNQALYLSMFGNPHRLLRIDQEGRFAAALDDSLGSNGTFVTQDNGLLIAEGETLSVVRYQLDESGLKNREVLAVSPSGIKPNDLCQTPHGDIYFTAPDFDSRTRSEVFRIAPSGEVSSVISDMTLPNGIIASNDGSILYVADSAEKLWRSYPILEDGTLGEGVVFFNPNVTGMQDPDGMTIDEMGNLYFTGRGGIWIVSPEGTVIEFVAVPEFSSNVTFGGPIGKTLYITCQSKIYSLAMGVRGGTFVE